jgi:hypothetical protein
MERCHSRTSNVVRRRLGHLPEPPDALADSIFVLRRSSRVASGVVSVVEVLAIERVKGEGDEQYGPVSAHGEGGGMTHREGERDEEEA